MFRGLKCFNPVPFKSHHTWALNRPVPHIVESNRQTGRFESYGSKVSRFGLWKNNDTWNQEQTGEYVVCNHHATLLQMGCTTGTKQVGNLRDYQVPPGPKRHGRSSSVCANENMKKLYYGVLSPCTTGTLRRPPKQAVRGTQRDHSHRRGDSTFTWEIPWKWKYETWWIYSQGADFWATHGDRIWWTPWYLYKISTWKALMCCEFTTWGSWILTISLNCCLALRKLF